MCLFLVGAWEQGRGVWFLFSWISSYYSQELEGVIVIAPYLHADYLAVLGQYNVYYLIS